MSNNTELAWAAGFWDGEGSCFIHKAFEGKYRYPKLSISQTGENQEELKRFQKAVGLKGKIYKHTRKDKNHQEAWALVYQKQEDIESVMKSLWPYLCSTKKEQYKTVKKNSTYFGGGGHKDICKNGHKMTEENTKHRKRGNWNLRECKQCGRDSTKRYQQRKNGREAP